MTERQMLEQCLAHFKLLKAFAAANGPIKQNGKPIGKARVIASEAQAAIDGLTTFLAAHAPGTVNS